MAPSTTEITSMMAPSLSQDVAVAELIDLIKEHGRWQEPPPAEGEESAASAAATTA